VRQTTSSLLEAESARRDRSGFTTMISSKSALNRRSVGERQQSTIVPIFQFFFFDHVIIAGSQQVPSNQPQAAFAFYNYRLTLGKLSCYKC
jgi:hypothetical protein